MGYRRNTMWWTQERIVAAMLDWLFAPLADNP